MNTLVGLSGSHAFVAGNHNRSGDVPITLETRNITTIARHHIGRCEQPRPQKQSVIGSFGLKGGTYNGAPPIVRAILNSRPEYRKR